LLQLYFVYVCGGVVMEGGNGFFLIVEDNDICGGVIIDGYLGFWLGFICNDVCGMVIFSNN